MQNGRTADIVIEAGPALRDNIALSIREHDHVDGVVSAIVAVVEKSLPVAGGPWRAGVKIRITGVQFDHVDSGRAHTVDIRRPDIGVIGNEIITVRNETGERADRHRRIVHTFNDERLSVEL